MSCAIAMRWSDLEDVEWQDLKSKEERGRK